MLRFHIQACLSAIFAVPWHSCALGSFKWRRPAAPPMEARRHLQTKTNMGNAKLREILFRTNFWYVQHTPSSLLPACRTDDPLHVNRLIGSERLGNSAISTTISVHITIGWRREASLLTTTSLLETCALDVETEMVVVNRSW